jgi:hypothetical protein
LNVGGGHHDGSHLDGVNDQLRAIVGFQSKHVRAAGYELGAQRAADVAQSRLVDLSGQAGVVSENEKIVR